MKMGRAHRVPLSDRVLELLKGLYEHRGKNRHVFAGARPGQAVARTTVYDQSERVTGGKASPHGWRATFRSWCSKTGVNFEAAELALAHAKGAIVGAYDRDDMIERRRVIMQDWANWLSGPASAKVIPLAGRRAYRETDPMDNRSLIFDVLCTTGARLEISSNSWTESQRDFLKNFQRSMVSNRLRNQNGLSTLSATLRFVETLVQPLIQQI